MSQDNKQKFLIGGIILCLAVVAGLGYTSWSLNHKVNQLEASNSHFFNTSSIPSSGHNTQWNTMMNQLAQMPKSFSGINRWMNQMIHQMAPGNMSQGISQFSFSTNSPSIIFKNNAHQYQFIVHFAKGQNIQINTKISNHILHISGTVQQSTSDKGHKFMSNSQFSSEFSQDYSLNQPVDKNAMKIIHHKHEIDIIIPKKHHS
ncbi:MAG: hypothetical protein CENE_02448 [Candidatus Celerinatantimonas neptuna]|nr:MAG: hypothetical protein CENE_02448 [Candidatus Celerinatantimonas neptuna]